MKIYPYYCFAYCPKGVKKKQEILDKNDSIIEAVWDFQDFVDKCFEDCPYLEERNNGLYKYRD